MMKNILKILLITGIILVIGINAVNASENVTMTPEQQNITITYDKEDADINLHVQNNKGNPVNDAEIQCDYPEADLYYVNNGTYYYCAYGLDAGTHKINFTLNNANTVTINIKVLQAAFPGKILCYKYYSTDKSTIKLKAKAYYGDTDNTFDGVMHFKINGKTYDVKTRNGIATKTIKISKAGTYTYTATFTPSDKNYKAGKAIGKNKVYVYSTSKSARTFNIHGYRFVVPVNKYINLVEAKNTKKVVGYQISTNKKVTVTVPKYKTVWKYIGTVNPSTAHEKCYYYPGEYKYDSYKKTWINSYTYYDSVKLYKKVYTKYTVKTVKKVYATISFNGKYVVELGSDYKYLFNVKSNTLKGLNTAKKYKVRGIF